MIDKLKKLKQTTFKKTNFKAFFFFLAFASIVWILVQFAKNYQQVVTINVEFVNLPKDKIINKKNANFQVRLNEKGFQLAWFGLVKPNIEIDLSTLIYDDKALYYILENQKYNLSKELGIDESKLDFIENQLRIPYVQKVVKKIPVLPQININFSPGFASANELMINPDSINVSGTEKDLNDIEVLKTKKTSLNKVEKDIEGFVKIDTSGLGQITLYEDEVHYELPVEKFTEGRIEVPIEIINPPANANVSIFPKKAIVIYKVGLAHYNEVSTADFRIVCDFKNLEEDQSFIIPKVLSEPSIITSYRLNLNKVQFVIKR